MMAMSIIPISLWDRTAPDTGLTGMTTISDRAALAIIGGGFTGLSTALHAAERGLDVQLIEAHDIGHGGSGRNVGLVNAGVWLHPSKVIATLGAERGAHFMRHFAAGPETVFNLIERHQINCEATRSGTIHAATSPSGLRDLETRWREWSAMGAPVDFLDARAVAARTGSRGFFGALLDHRAGTINPMGYCRGLARQAIAAGARIATNRKVQQLEKTPGGWRLHMDGAVLQANTVVLATNAYSDNLWPDLAHSYDSISYFQMATDPLGARAASILPGGQGLWDTGKIMMSLRRDKAGRLIIGSMGAMIGTPQKGVSQRWANRKLARLFPDLGPVEFTNGWDGQIAMTSDHLPRIHQLDDGLFTPVGYNGRGITTGTIFGMAIAELLTGGDRANLPVALTHLQQSRPNRLMPALYRIVFAANQIVRGL